MITLPPRSRQVLQNILAVVPLGEFQNSNFIFWHDSELHMKTILLETTKLSERLFGVVRLGPAPNVAPEAVTRLVAVAKGVCALLSRNFSVPLVGLWRAKASCATLTAGRFRLQSLRQLLLLQMSSWKL